MADTVKLFKDVKAKFGKVDIAINNVGKVCNIPSEAATGKLTQIPQCCVGPLGKRSQAHQPSSPGPYILPATRGGLQGSGSQLKKEVMNPKP